MTKKDAEWYDFDVIQELNTEELALFIGDKIFHSPKVGSLWNFLKTPAMIQKTTEALRFLNTRNLESIARWSQGANPEKEKNSRIYGYEVQNRLAGIHKTERAWELENIKDTLWELTDRVYEAKSESLLKGLTLDNRRGDVIGLEEWYIKESEPDGG